MRTGENLDHMNHIWLIGDHTLFLKLSRTVNL